MTPETNTEYQNKEQDRRITWLENHYTTFNKEFGDLQKQVAGIETDVKWLVKSYWVIVTASIGAVVSSIINIIIR